MPTVPTDRSRPGTSYQVGHTYVASTNLINEAKVGAAWNGQRIKPVGDFWLRDTFGFQYPELFDTPGFVAGGIPNATVAGGIARDPRPELRAALADDRHHGPGHADVDQGQPLDPHAAWPSRATARTRTAAATYFGASTSTRAATRTAPATRSADMLLGNFRTYDEASADPVGFFRFTTYQGFVSDTWRVRNNLSLEVGLRYEYTNPTYTQQNNLVNFDPSPLRPGQAVTVLPNGLLVPGVGNRFNGLIIGGDGIPEDQQGRVDFVEGGDYDRIPFGAPRGLYDAQHLFMPRFSFAYSLNP